MQTYKLIPIADCYESWSGFLHLARSGKDASHEASGKTFKELAQ